MMKRFSILLSMALTLTLCTYSTIAEESAQWWKGNLHTHSLWSDGDDYPDMIADWYKSQGYDFLALSDHNVLMQKERWVNPIKNRGGSKAFEKYLGRFGAKWVETRVDDGVYQVRLKPWNEIRARFEEPGRFLMIQAEEITDNFKDEKYKVNLPVHLNGLNVIDYIAPQGGDSVQETMQNNINAVLLQRRETGQPMFPHMNHPNFVWGITAEELAGLDGEQFFEVYNGHPDVRNEGDEIHASMERMWDIILTKRLGELNKPIMYGIATDDAHNYHKFTSRDSNPGRGWVVVRAAFLTPEHIIHAMEAGDFYASSGVVLDDIQHTKNQMTIHIHPENGVEFETLFYGTRKGYDAASKPMNDPKTGIPVTRKYSKDVGEVLAIVSGAQASYTYNGDELYVRAKVVSSKLKENPYREGEFEQAWVQPVVVAPVK
ncbi:MAG: hypothetical protein P9L94_10465 [Candidatus Hinthialibacter antarcticus]|nr:hypothetical protein [Candidatus Hinthialibacter antarcticus]